MLKRLRAQTKLTQLEVATASGIDRSRYNRLEREAMPLTDYYASKLAPVLGVDVWDGVTLPEAARRPDDTETLSYLGLLSELRSRLEEAEAALDRLGPNLDLLGGLPARVAALEKQGPPRTQGGENRR